MFKCASEPPRVAVVLKFTFAGQVVIQNKGGKLSKSNVNDSAKFSFLLQFKPFVALQSIGKLWNVTHFVVPKIYGLEL